MMKIIYLEDDHNDVMQYQPKLEEFGFDVTIAKGSKEAYSLFKKNKDFDLLLCDIILDHNIEDRKININGITVAGNVLRNFYEIPIIFFTKSHDETSYKKQIAKEINHSFYKFVKKSIMKEHEDSFLSLIENVTENFYFKEKYKDIFHERTIGLSTGRIEDGAQVFEFYKYEDIIYLESGQKQTRIFVLDKYCKNENESSVYCYIIHKTLTETIKQIQYNFPNIIRAGRSHGVNISKIQSLHLNRNELKLEHIKEQIRLYKGWQIAFAKHKIWVQTH